MSCRTQGQKLCTSVRLYVHPSSRGYSGPSKPPNQPSQAPNQPSQAQNQSSQAQNSALSGPKSALSGRKLAFSSPKSTILGLKLALSNLKSDHFGLNSALKKPSQASNLPSSLISFEPLDPPNQPLHASLLCSNKSNQPLNVPSQDVWKFTPVSYRTSALWGRCPALTLLLQLITPSRALGTADHVRSLDD